MASRKMKLKKEHTTFNVPITVISEEDARKRIIDALKENSESKEVTQDTVSEEHSLESTNQDSGNVRTFTGIAYSGKPIEKHFMFENLYLDVDGMTFKDQIPIFKNHDPNTILGYANLYRKNGKLMAEGILATDLPDAKEVAALSDAGFAWELSVGVEPSYIEEVSQDKQFSINGQQVVGPATIFRGPKVMETSFVPIGADSNTSAQVFNKDLDKFKNIEVRNMEITTIKVDGKDVEYSQSEDGKFSVMVELDELNAETEYTFCPCMGEELEDDETEKKKKSLADENSALLEELASLREEVKAHKREAKKAKFTKAIETSAIEMGDDEFETLLLLPEDKFEAFLSKIENTKVVTGQGSQKTQSATKELFKQDKPATELSNDDSVEAWKEKARALQKEYKEKGFELSIRDAMSKLMA